MQQIQGGYPCMTLQQYITQYVHAIWQYGQEGLNSSVPLALLIYENY